MTDIGSAVRAAGRTLASLFNGAHILCELLVEQVELSVIGVYMAMTAISGIMPWWQVIISILILYATAWGCVILSGKIYTSAMLLNGTKFSPRDILVFLRAK